MPRFAANLSFLFTELPFPERFAAAAAAGFGGVEFLFPYAWPVEAIAGWRRAAGVDSVLFNLPPGDWEAGERGLACLPGREAEFLDGIERALPYALALGTPGCTRWPGCCRPEPIRRTAGRSMSTTCAAPPHGWPHTASRC